MNIEEINKWLDKEYGCSYTILEELFDFEIDKQLKLFDKVEQLEKENTDLKKQLEYLRSGEYLNQLKFERNMLENIVQNMEVSKEDKEFIDMTHRNTELLEENQELKEKIEYLKSKIENKDRWCQLIADIGYDYDGFNKVDSLKGLIDELVKYALYSRDDYDYLQWIEDGNNDK